MLKKLIIMEKQITTQQHATTIQPSIVAHHHPVVDVFNSKSLVYHQF